MRSAGAGAGGSGGQRQSLYRSALAMTEPSDDPKPVHRRRPRYRGTHPRRFEEKYKELASEAYPELVAHVIARGKTPAGQHVPILVDEVLAVLEPRSGERGVDATLGWGGHAQRLLERLAPGGTLVTGYPMVSPLMSEAFRLIGYPNIDEDHVSPPVRIAAALRSVLRPAGRAAFPPAPPTRLALFL